MTTPPTHTLLPPAALAAKPTFRSRMAPSAAVTAASSLSAGTVALLLTSRGCRLRLSTLARPQ